MRVLKSIFEFYLNSSIHVALAVCALVWVTLLDFNVGVDLEFIYFMFFAAITGYNFVKYFGLAKFYHRRLANWLKYIQLFSLLCFVGMVYYAIKLPQETLIYFGVLGLITFLYAIPFLPKSYFIDNSMNLRAVSGLKTYVIAFVWSCATVIIPLIHEGYPIEFDVLITALQRFIFVSAVMIPFDIYDLNYDNVKLATIPQKIGVRNAKIMGVILMILFYLLEFMKDELIPKNIKILAFISILTILVLLISRKRQSKYFSLFWVESIPIIWMIMVIANY